MNQISAPDCHNWQLHLLFMSTPELWVMRPYLPLVRRLPGCEVELGLMYDVFHLNGLTGFGCTVFFANLFLLPPDEDQFLALPKEVYDTVEEIYAAGWRVD